ncbi:MAG TPA: NAD-dependent epimerase/dehydratase family protein [Psychromonas hadalis]|nr:NAD-dependent epimerase/dehydratase family protein [Psychromonas hadalis]
MVTGTTGFIGSHLCQRLSSDDSFNLLKVTRKGAEIGDVSIDFSTDFNLQSELNGVDVIIHCAARVHHMIDSDAQPLVAYRQVNTKGTLKLAQQAADAGVKRFVFLSSIKVNGEKTSFGQPFTSQVDRAPSDDYALSKYEAELGLLKIAEKTKMDVVIIRPPLVYGKGVKVNFLAMMNVVRKGLPLPLGAINNKRSLLYIGNLIDLMVTCISHKKAANRVLLASDDHDLSTSDLLRKLAKVMEVKSRLIPMPQSWLLNITKLLRKKTVGQRLCSSLQVDISETKEHLNWVPPYSVEEGLSRTVENMKKKKRCINSTTTRILDFSFALFGLLLLWPVLLVVCVVGYFDAGSPVFFQTRVGKNKKPFTLIKLRSMPIKTKSVATHIVDASEITRYGQFIRKTKLDELPQLINVLKGEMSFVGPRPCLFNQQELIDEREALGVLNVLPGITGLAQINGIDMSTPEKLASIDAKMIKLFSLKAYFLYIIQTATGKGRGDKTRL